MARMPRISDAQWQVMEALWEAGPATANEIVVRLTGQVECNDRTLRTHLNRLVAKGVVSAEPGGKEYRYRATVTRAQALKHKSDSFLATLSDQLTMPALVHFVRKARLSRHDIAQLRKLLDEKEQRQ